MNKLSYRHLNEDVHLHSIQQTYVSLNRELYILRPEVWRLQLKSAYKPNNISILFSGDGRSMQNDVNNSKRNKKEATNVVTLFRSVPVNNSSSCSTPPQLDSGPWSPSLLVSIYVVFYGVRLSAPRPTLNLTEQISVFMATETRWHSYNITHWVARDPGGATSRTHSNCESLRSVASTVGWK